MGKDWANFTFILTNRVRSAKMNSKYERKEAEKMTNMLYNLSNTALIFIFVHASGLVLA